MARYRVTKPAAGLPVSGSGVTSPGSAIGRTITRNWWHARLDQDDLLEVTAGTFLVAGSTPTPDAGFMAQVARRLTDPVDGFLAGHRMLICDRDAKWTDGFRRIVQGTGVRIALTPVQAPNANAYAERFVRSIREECLDRLILFGEHRLLRALDDYVAHYHKERNHQGLGNALIVPEVDSSRGSRVRCRERLGGLLRYYHRAA